jgi:hypothetical protein
VDPPLLLLALVAGVVLAAWWIVRLRADLDRRSGRAAEWEGADGPGSLWTSAARCPECHADGALLTREEDGLWHTCLSCGHRHARDNRG